MGKINSVKYAWKSWSSVTKITDYVVMDLETTGLSPKTDQIIEIGMIRVSGGQLADRFSRLVNPGIPLSSKIKKLTGLSDELLANASLFSGIAESVVDFINGSTIVGHNITFDLSFLEEALSRCGIHTQFTYLDTLALSRRAFPNYSSHTLETMNSCLSLYDGPSHRALDDALCTQALFRHIQEMFSDLPFIDAVSSCCTPIEGYKFSPSKKPFEGKTFVLIGSFTFPYSAAKKLISSAGGTVLASLDSNANYLVYGYRDEISDPTNSYESIMSQAVAMQESGSHLQLINEVHLLKLCGVTFFD